MKKVKTKTKKVKVIGDGAALGSIAHPVAPISEKTLFEVIALVRLADAALNAIYEILGLNGDISADLLERAEMEIKKKKGKGKK